MQVKNGKVDYEHIDYEHIENVILSKGFGSEPAFSNTTFNVEPIPCLNGSNACPIGLYLYRENKIVVSPGWSEGTLLHELGHRYGHYYYDDLSESFAESFRKEQVAYLLPQRFVVAEGTGADMVTADWAKVDNLFMVGEKGEFLWRLDFPITPVDVTALQNALRNAGLNASVAASNSTVIISFTQLSLPFFQTVASTALPPFESGSTITYFIVYKLEGSWLGVIAVSALSFLLLKKLKKIT